jgi:deoxyribodipyrimidine photo-lyase
MNSISIVWLRRDLRLEDNAAVYYALKESSSVLPLFIFDTEILHPLEATQDARVTYIYHRVMDLKRKLESLGSTLLVKYGSPLDVFRGLVSEYPVNGVYFNRDYEPYARERDSRVSRWLTERGVKVRDYKDQVIFEKDEVVKQDGSPYTVFTPYMKRWKQMLQQSGFSEYSTKGLFSRFNQTAPIPALSLSKMGFQETETVYPPSDFPEEVIRQYDQYRDYPALSGTTRLGVHLRFGTISIRQAVRKALELNETWLNELIWREFYMMILWHFPRVVDRSFKPAYDDIAWRNDPSDFEAWTRGTTGYPLVDAGMRQLNVTGYMHNRARMVTASFLTKHLLIDWRWGESYFAEKLLDYELASNNGGWQWAAGSGCDAAPYFRIFNPQRQAERFDPQQRYIDQWVSERSDPAYPQPLVDHAFARKRALDVYKNAVKK